MTKRILALLAVLCLFALAACGDDSSDAGDSEGKDDKDSAYSAARAADEGTGPCAYTDDSMGAARDVEAPPSTPLEKGKVNVTIETNRGDVKAVLDAKNAPCTVNSFLSLADQDYFDDTQCHRLTTQGIFVLQCGDPTATGTGGPGYTHADELTGKEKYAAGTLAMANSGVADTNGSQFFMVYKDSLGLPPNYTVFGSVDTASIKMLQKVAAKGTDDVNAPGDGAPVESVTIDEVDD